MSSRGGEPPVADTGNAAQPTPDDDTGPTMPLDQSVAMWIREVGEGDDFRHHFISAFTQGAASSAKQIGPGEVASLRATIVRVKRGELVLVERDGRWQLVTPLGFETTDPPGEHHEWRNPIDVGEQTVLDVIDADYWKQTIADVPGVGVASLVKEARRLAPTVGVEVPSGLDSMSDPRLVAVVLAWLDEKRAS